MKTSGRGKSTNIEDRRGQKLKTSGSSSVARKKTFYDGIKPFIQDSLSMAYKAPIKGKKNGPK